MFHLFLSQPTWGLKKLP